MTLGAGGVNSQVEGDTALHRWLSFPPLAVPQTRAGPGTEQGTLSAGPLNTKIVRSWDEWVRACGQAGVGTGDQDAPLAVDGVQSVAGVSKSIYEKKGVLASRGGNAAGHWRTGGEDYKYRNKHPCFMQGLATIEMWAKLVKTFVRWMQNRNK